MLRKSFLKMVGRYPLNEVANVRNILLRMRETFNLKKDYNCVEVFMRELKF